MKAWHVIRDVIINLTVIAVILVVFEIGVRILSPQILGSPMIEDSLLGWRNRPSVTKTHQHRDYKYNATVNVKGLRGSNGVFYEKPKDKERILILGDSYTWGEGVDDDETFSAYLDDMLGPDTEVINAGVDGYGTDQQYLYFKEEGYKYEPDIVLLAFCLNDMENNVLDIASNRTSVKPRFSIENNTLKLHNVPIKESDKKGPIWDCHHYLRDRSHLYSILRRVYMGITYKYYMAHNENPPWHKFLFRRLTQARESKGYKNDGQALYYPYLKEWPVEVQDRWELSQRLILETARLAESKGAEFVVVLIPYAIEIYKQDWLQAADKYNLNVSAYNLSIPRRKFEQMSMVYDIPVIFLDEVFREEAIPRLYFDQDLHFSRYGHQAAAKGIYKFLKERQRARH